MTRLGLLLFVVMLPSGAVWAQLGGPDEAQAAPRAAAAPAQRNDFRKLSGYAFPQVSDTVRDMQNLAHAMQLRDYCADARIPDEFVRVQLARFSLITAREENCQTLLDY
ncbi:MAG TPA: hypothetical protein PK725_09885 [Rhodocyclaceae bacterium]|jgi:hypothetical protein|nr:hypothetical protein [Rhodocyclaceae bacterium]HRQ47249.1 hypothetical protein [Rhodocyclaceae bacterium]